MTPIGLNRISVKSSTLIIFYFSSLLLLVLLRRDSTSQEFAIQVGTPRRGSSQRINTMHAARNAKPVRHELHFLSAAITDRRSDRRSCDKRDQSLRSFFHRA